MSHIGYFLEIEGIETILATEAFTGAGSWAGRTFIGVFAPGGLGQIDYGIEPLDRKPKVSVLSVSLVDYHGSGDAAAGVLTDLFATAKSQTRIYLQQDIQQADAMAGAGTVTTNADLSGLSYPLAFYIDRETFTATGYAGASNEQFTGVTRAQYGSRADRHWLYHDEYGHISRCYLYPPSWMDRLVKLYRVDDDDVANATQIMVGPLLDLTPEDVNNWTLKIGSVLKLLEKRVFGESNNATVKNYVQYLFNKNGDGYVGLEVAIEGTVVRPRQTCTGNGAHLGELHGKSYCTDLNEPDGFWSSRYGLRFLTGDMSQEYFNIDETNDGIRITEQAGPAVSFTSNIDHDEYVGADALATEISTQLTADSPSGWTYTATANNDQTFTISANGANTFSLDWSHADGTMYTMLGWEATDTSAANSHDGTHVWSPYDLDPLWWVWDFTNSSGELIHAAPHTSTLSATGDFFEIVRMHKYPPQNKFFGFLAVYRKKLIGLLPYPWVYVTPTDPDGSPAAAFVLYQGIDGTPVRENNGGNVNSDNDPVPGELLEEIYTNYRVNGADRTIDELHDWRGLVSKLMYGYLSETQTNPLDWFLQLATSTGEGWNGSYDVLHSNHGAAIPSSLFNDTEIHALAGQMPNYRLGYKHPKSLLEILINEICIPMGLYPHIDSSGQISVQKIARQNTAATPDAALTQAHVEAAGGRIAVQHDHVGLSSSFEVRYGWDPGQDKLKVTHKIINRTADLLYPDTKCKTYECNIWFPAYWSKYEMSGGEFRASVLEPSITRVLERTSHAQVFVTLTVPFADKDGTSIGQDLRPGDTVTLTTTNPIPLPSGTRTLSAEWFEVQNITLDFNRSIATLKLYWLGWYYGKYSLWNWSGDVKAWNGGTNTATVGANYLKSGTDHTDYLTAGDKVIIHYCADSRKGGATYGDTEEMTTHTITAGSVKFTGAPTNALVAGDVIAMCDYDSATTAQKAWAYFSEENNANINGDETVGTNKDDPYVLV